MSEPIFNFSIWTKEPVILSSECPRMTLEMRGKVVDILAAGCSCHHDKPRTATLRKRVIVGNVNVYLQCDACGASLGSALARKDHYNWQDYPAWDDSLLARYEAARQTIREERISQSFAQFPSMEGLDFGETYAEWRATAPEWREAKRLVMWRSRGHCEACLDAPATVVHHLTYKAGFLPPAWFLRAVCEDCHRRLHNGKDEWCAEGMAKNLDASD